LKGLFSKKKKDLSKRAKEIFSLIFIQEAAKSRFLTFRVVCAKICSRSFNH